MKIIFTIIAAYLFIVTFLIIYKLLSGLRFFLFLRLTPLKSSFKSNTESNKLLSFALSYIITFLFLFIFVRSIGTKVMKFFDVFIEVWVKEKAEYGFAKHFPQKYTLFLIYYLYYNT